MHAANDVAIQIASNSSLVHLQPLKAASQDPAEMSDSKVNDDAKFEQFKKAVNEQLVDFMLVTQKMLIQMSQAITKSYDQPFVIA